MRRQTRDRGARLNRPTGTWGAGQGRQDSECRTGGRGRKGGILFGQAVQDWNKGGKLGAKDQCTLVSGWRMVGGVSTRRVKGEDPENSRQWDGVLR